MVHLVTQMIWPVARPLAQWAEVSQRHACRNAMVASTAIAATRQERDETQEYVETLIARHARRAGPTSPLPAARLG
jgi:hypothetical protein